MLQKYNSVLFIVITTMMGVLTLLPSDIYLPALPMLQHDFAITASVAGLTLSIFFLGAGLSQIIAGPIVDGFDNKKISLIALVIFTVVSLLSVIASSISLLLLYRFIQAFSAGFVVVISRTLVVKLSSKEEALRIFLIMSPIIAISPGVAPIIGGYTAKYFGWRASFVFITLFGMLLTYLCAKYIPKTISNVNNIHPRQIIKTYIKLLSNKKFMIYLLVRTGIDSSYFGYITASPFIFYNLGYTAAQIGNFYLLIAVSYILMTYICKKYIGKLSIDLLIQIGLGISLAGIFMLACIGYAEIKSAVLIIIAAAIMTAGYGFAGPLSWSEAMAQGSDNDAGSTSSLIGFLPLAASAVAATLINSVSHNSPIRLSMALFVILIVPAIMHYAWIYKNHTRV